MAEVQWIRLMVGMFDGDSFKRIKRAKIGGVPFRDKLTAVWFELLDLAGKSNANGYLINSNEIPYRSFEDIATMLDRDEKEIELCMQYFVSEQMVEIIDDIYCLTNFIRYQNQDGLAKIREQNRLRQKKWYDKKKALEVPNEKPNVRLTLSNALELELDKDIEEKIEINKEKKDSPIFISIFEHWNNKNIIKHREITEEISNAIEKAMKSYTEEEIKTYIDRYATVISDKSYFWSYKWSLKDFLSRKDGISSFTDEGSKWVNYSEKCPKAPTSKRVEYIDEDTLKIKKMLLGEDEDGFNTNG